MNHKRRIQEFWCLLCTTYCCLPIFVPIIAVFCGASHVLQPSFPNIFASSYSKNNLNRIFSRSLIRISSWNAYRTSNVHATMRLLSKFFFTSYIESNFHIFHDISISIFDFLLIFGKKNYNRIIYWNSDKLRDESIKKL